MTIIFLVDWLLTTPIFALEIAKTGKGYKNISTPIFFSLQHCHPHHNSLRETLSVHELCLKFGFIVRKPTLEPTKQGSLA